MRTAELLKILKQHGVYKIREGNNHAIYYSPLTNKKFAVSRHAKELPKGTASAILKQAGIEI